MEKEGVGRPSTYASTISGLIRRSYVEVKAKYFAPTLLGKAVNEHLVKNFPDIMEIKFTKKMELDLDQVAEAKLSYKAVIGEFDKVLFEQLSKIDTPDTGVKCPLCKAGSMTEKNGKLGQFYSCNRYPECKFTIAGEFRKVKITRDMVKKLCIPPGTTDVLEFKKADGGIYHGVLFLNDNKLEFQFASSSKKTNIEGGR
jgi:DNA topoisomerase-1